jgi:DNA mismatch endonuclease, patch repair protein
MKAKRPYTPGDDPQDIYSPKKRSEIMSRVRSKNTKPERIVRSALHRAGYRFRIHRKDLPGHPDIVLPRHRMTVLIHGCFWHQHPGCKKATLPVRNAKFWKEKLQRNQERDRQNLHKLEGLGWKVFVIWECNLLQGLSELINQLRETVDESEIRYA